MKKEFASFESYPRKRVILHMQLVDLLVVFLPMALIVIFVAVIPAAYVTGDLAGGLAEGGYFLSVFFCVLYGFLALMLALATRKNITFRIVMATLLSFGSIFYIGFLR